MRVVIEVLGLVVFAIPRDGHKIFSRVDERLPNKQSHNNNTHRLLGVVVVVDKIVPLPNDSPYHP